MFYVVISVDEIEEKSGFTGQYEVSFGEHRLECQGSEKFIRQVLSNRLGVAFLDIDELFKDGHMRGSGYPASVAWVHYYLVEVKMLDFEPENA